MEIVANIVAYGVVCVFAVVVMATVVVAGSAMVSGTVDLTYHLTIKWPYRLGHYLYENFRTGRIVLNVLGAIVFLAFIVFCFWFFGEYVWPALNSVIEFFQADWI